MARQCLYLKLQIPERYLLHVTSNCGMRYHGLTEVQAIQGCRFACVVQAYKNQLVLLIWKPIRVE